MSTDMQDQAIEPSADGEPAGQDDYAALAAMVRQVVIEDPGLLLAVLGGACQRALDAIKQPPGQVYDVFAPDGEPMTISPVGSFEDLLAAWRERYKRRAERPGQLAGFVGVWIQLSKDGRSVITPWGRHMLDIEGGADEPNPGGHFGMAPVPIKQAAPAAPVDEEELPEDEENDEIEGDDDDILDGEEDDEA
jgi:hypothetical protein